jgi:predicted small secreted protein
MKRAVIFGIFVLLAGCNTVEGIGRDISATARGVGNAF